MISLIKNTAFKGFAVRNSLSHPTSSTVFKRLQSTMDEYETKIYQILQEKFEPKQLEVRDVSGGCGSMFSIDIESTGFKGLSMIKQHRLVNDVLKDEISKWHGLQLKTRVPKSD